MFRSMKFVMLALCLSVPGCAEKKTETQTPVKRGKYLVTVTGCNDCHTPKIAGPGGIPVLDEKRLLAAIRKMLRIQRGVRRICNSATPWH